MAFLVIMVCVGLKPNGIYTFFIVTWGCFSIATIYLYEKSKKVNFYKYESKKKNL